MVIRGLGFIVGLLFIVVSPFIFYSGEQSFIQCLSSFILGILFLIYGVKGNAGIRKILPKNINLKLW